MKKIGCKSGRGRELERRIEKVLKLLEETNSNFSYLRLNVPRLGNGTFLKAQPCDFVCNFGVTHIYFDCKETHSSILYLSKIPDHQIASLRRYQGQGNRAGFLIWFKGVDPTGNNLIFCENFTENMTPESGVNFMKLLGVDR
jgi:penicillin-binding protein-related factor A (putative recombinase)